MAKALSKLDCKVIVVIDDIDRITNAQIRMVFQLVNSIAKFPNVVYLLSFDRTVVCRALEEMQKCNGEEYLEKIIQFSVVLPEARKEQVSEMLFTRMEELLEDAPSVLFDEERWSLLYLSCIDPAINSVRDVNRFMNTFAMLHQALCGEVDFSDLAVISVLQVWNPSLYRWMYENASHICGPVHRPVFGKHQSSERNDAKELEESIRKAVGDEGLAYAVETMKTLFPKCMYLFGHVITSETSDSLFAQGRIADSRCFDLAFCIPSETSTLSKNEAKIALADMNVEELSDLLHAYVEKGFLWDFASYLNGSYSSVPKGRYPTIIEAVFQVLGKSREPQDGVLFVSVDRVLIHSAEEMLRHIDDEVARDLFKRVLPTLDAESLMAFAIFLNSQELDQGRYGEGEKDRELWAISSSCLDQVEQAYVDRMRQLSIDENLFERPDCGFAMAVWEKLDGCRYRAYVDNASRASDLAIAMSIVRQAGRSASLSYPSEPCWAYSDAVIKSEDRPAILEAIDRLRLSGQFWILPDQDREKITTYYLADGPKNVDTNWVPINQVREQIALWRDEYDEL